MGSYRPVEIVSVLSRGLAPVILVLISSSVWGRRRRQSVGELEYFFRHLDVVFFHELDELLHPMAIDLVSQEADGGAFVAGPASPADPMNVALEVPGDVQIDDSCDVLDVQSPRSHVGGDEHIGHAALKHAEVVVPLAHLQIPIELRSLNLFVPELVCDDV